MAQVFKAISDQTRREILKLLSNGEKSAGEISEHFNFSKPTISQHLSLLKDADLVRSRRNKNQILYSLNMSVLEEALTEFLNLIQSEGEEDGKTN